MTELIQPQEYTAPVNEQGEWSIEIPNTFPPGLHAVITQSQKTQQKDAGVFFVQAQEDEDLSPIQGATAQFPGYLALAILRLLLIVLALAAMNIRLGQHAEVCEDVLDKEKLLKKKTHTHHAILFSTCMILVALIISYQGGKKSGLYEMQYAEINSALEALQNSVIHKVTGRLQTPFEHKPFAGVDVSAADMTVRTQESGQYVVFNVSSQKGIQIAHPQLTSTFFIQTTKERLDIIFDPALYNTVAHIVRRDAYRDAAKLYEVIYSQVQEKISLQKFTESYQYNFTPDILTEQSFTLRAIEELGSYVNKDTDLMAQRVVRVRIVHNDKVISYILTQDEQGGWKLFDW